MQAHTHLAILLNRDFILAVLVVKLGKLDEKRRQYAFLEHRHRIRGGQEVDLLLVGDLGLGKVLVVGLLGYRSRRNT
jgi:hypothetical protein